MKNSSSLTVEQERGLQTIKLGDGIRANASQAKEKAEVEEGIKAP